MTHRPLPTPFIARLQKEFGSEAEDLIAQIHHSESAARTLRILEGIDPHEIKGFQSIGQVPWCESAHWFNRTIEEDSIPIHHYPGYQTGAWHVQEASGLLLDYLLPKIQGMGLQMNLILDACAAPGGKTLTLLKNLPSEGILVAAEPQQDRLNTLLETISRTGTSQVMVTNANATAWGAVPNLWDGILVDIPCSGEGMFRKNHDALKEWSLNKCEACAQIQYPILESLVRSLRPGGWMIYCTCTYGFLENTEMLKPWILNDILEPMEIQIPEEWGFTPASVIDNRWPDGSSAWWAIPGKVEGEGFFCAILRKSQDDGFSSTASARLAFDSSLADAERSVRLKAIWPKNIKVLRDGLPLWSKVGVPSQDLAHALGRRRTTELQEQLKKIGFVWHEMSLEEPLASWYLQGQSLRIGDLREGWNLMCYQGLGLGWMHKNGETINNYYPKSRRIRR